MLGMSQRSPGPAARPNAAAGSSGKGGASRAAYSEVQGRGSHMQLAVEAVVLNVLLAALMHKLVLLRAHAAAGAAAGQLRYGRDATEPGASWASLKCMAPTGSGQRRWS